MACAWCTGARSYLMSTGEGARTWGSRSAPATAGAKGSARRSTYRSRPQPAAARLARSRLAAPSAMPGSK
eukprot:scaffold28338_cov63-Phaeocystis_antarctica.AAC.6